MVYETLVENHKKVVITPMAVGLVLMAASFLGVQTFIVGTVLYAAGGAIHFGLLFYSDFLGAEDVDDPLRATLFTLLLLTFASIGIFTVFLLLLSLLL